MRVVIEAATGPRTGGRWLLRTGQRMTFGRTEQADVMIPDPMMSSSHFCVSVAHDACLVQDLESTNGTWVDGQKIISQQMLSHEKIKAGESEFVFTVDTGDSDPPAGGDASAKSSGIAEPRFDGPSSKASAGAMPGGAQVASPNGPRPLSKTLPASSIPTIPAAQRRKTQPVRVIPQGLQVQVTPCRSGIYRATQLQPVADPAAIVALLATLCPPTFIIDFAQTGIEPDDQPEDGPPDYLMAHVPPEAAKDVSPRMVASSDHDVRAVWLQDGWGADGMIVLFTQVPLASLLEHIQNIMGVGPSSSKTRRGMSGLCWPSILEAWLCDGESKSVTEFVEPCDALLLDSPDAVGGWALFGDDRLLQLLKTCGIPHTLEAPKNSETES